MQGKRELEKKMGKKVNFCSFCVTKPFFFSDEK